MSSAAAKLRLRLSQPEILALPCCYDGLSARLVAQAGFEATFMSGFCVSATAIGAPDTGLISFGEMRDAVARICAAVELPVIADGDTGYGNPMNVKRTVRAYAQAGAACIMLEDQVAPKRCGHTEGKQLVDRAEARARIRAAVEAREEGADILILARTDARDIAGLDEALWRAEAFADLGADIIFVEAPRDAAELERCAQVSDRPTFANMLEGGRTPWMGRSRLQEMGFSVVAYPLSLLNVGIQAMQGALRGLAEDRGIEDPLSFAELRRIVGFDDYERGLVRFRE